MGQNNYLNPIVSPKKLGSKVLASHPDITPKSSALQQGCSDKIHTQAERLSAKEPRQHPQPPLRVSENQPPAQLTGHLFKGA